MIMKCKNCGYFVSEDRLCTIKNAKFVKDHFPECRYSSESEIRNAEICYNCKWWMGKGDCGTSCKKRWGMATKDGFSVTCAEFQMWKR